MKYDKGSKMEWAQNTAKEVIDMMSKSTPENQLWIEDFMRKMIEIGKSYLKLADSNLPKIQCPNGHHWDWDEMKCDNSYCQYGR